VVHSATKLMDGQGRVLGGVTVGDPELIQKIYLFSRQDLHCLRLMHGFCLKV
jgi:cystathionine beta-lyase/cystathionine gamma-synthase